MGTYCICGHGLFDHDKYRGCMVEGCNCKNFSQATNVKFALHISLDLERNAPNEYLAKWEIYKFLKKSLQPNELKIIAKKME